MADEPFDKDLLPWQQKVLDAALERDADGEFVHQRIDLRPPYHERPIACAHAHPVRRLNGEPMPCPSCGYKPAD